MASYQIRKIAGRACAGNTGNVLLATDFKGNGWLSIPACITARARCTCRDACRGRYSRWRGKRSRRMRNPQHYVSDKRHMACNRATCYRMYEVLKNLSWVAVAASEPDFVWFPIFPCLVVGLAGCTLAYSYFLHVHIWMIQVTQMGKWSSEHTLVSTNYAKYSCWGY